MAKLCPCPKRKRRRRKPTARTICKSGFSFQRVNPRTGKPYVRGMCITVRGKVRTHPPRRVAPITPQRTISLSGHRRRR